MVSPSQFWCSVLSLVQALIDVPDMVRGQMNFKRLTLTDIKIAIKRVPNKKTLIATMEAAGIIISEMVGTSEAMLAAVLMTEFYFVCRCQEQVGKQLMGKKTHCSKEESLT
ncbi:putative ribosomal protein L14 [Helianthus annuus]|nr:putative ribosomal protein L14 [Helianthus annuus]